MDNIDRMENIDKNETKKSDVNGNGGKIREDKINNLDKNIIQSEIEYDELFDLMAKRRQLLEKK